MQGVQRSTLVVGVDQQTFEKVSKVLSAVKFFADYAETGTTALESTSFLPFDAIVTGYPLPDMQMQTFLDAVRKKDSPCRQAGLVILALRGMLPEADTFVGKGANRTLALEDFPDELPQVLFRLLEVPPRFPMRAISRLKVQLSWGTSQTICQTENVSAHGLLIKTDHPYPVGTQMAFELAIPGERSPVRGFAVVVRQTQEKRERVTGLGVRFSSFEGEDLKRLVAALAKLAT
ncbi:MAG: PilZ domain-containing protein [Acidobacteriia bacterium]|nr:PilZ domain-containing protein [Terriglobia bacterium]